jgi:hypothetical protein
MPLCVGKDQCRSPRAAIQEPPRDAEMLTQLLHVGEEVFRRVHAHVGVRITGVRRAASAAALVEEHDAVPLGIEVAAIPQAASRSRATVNNKCRLTGGTAAHLPIDVVAVTDVEKSVGIRLDRRVRLHQLTLPPPLGDGRFCGPACGNVTRSVRLRQLANEGQSADVSGVDFNEIFALASGCAFAAVGLLASPSSAASCLTRTARGARLGSE